MSWEMQKSINDSVIDLFKDQEKRISSIEAKFAEFEEYFTTIESILFKIQAVYEAIKEQGDHD